MRYTWGKGDVVLAAEQQIASAHRSWVRERAEVTIGDEEWLFRADGRDRIGESQGQVRIRARPRSIWSRRYDVDGAQASYSLGAKSIWSTRLTLTRHEAEVGEVRRSSAWANRPELTTTMDLAAEDAVFVLWLAYLLAARDDSSAAGA